MSTSLVAERARAAQSDSATSVNPLVVISILNWNGWQDTLACLESVRRLQYPNYLTVVVDNGSWDESVEGIRAWAKATLSDQDPFIEYTRAEATSGGCGAAEARLDSTNSSSRLVLVANETNLGFTGGNNLSISYALSRTTPADYLFLLNNDVLLEPDCLTQLVAADRAADAGLVGAVLRPRSELAPEKPERHGAEANEQVDGARANAQGGGAGSRNAWKPMGYVSGGAVLVRKDLLEAVRKVQGTYLDDRLFLYVEDVALSLAAQQLGYKTVQATRAVGYHTAGTSSGGRYSPIEYYYGTRNSIRVAALRPRSERLRFHAMFPWEAAGRVAKSLIYARPRSALAVVLGFLDGYRGVTGRWQDHDRQALKGPR